ncbi:hypothetical protein ABTK99_19655, partial [Acinetobacter baumannii]
RTKLSNGCGWRDPTLCDTNRRQAQCCLNALPAICRGTYLLELATGMAKIGLPQLRTATQDAGLGARILSFQPVQRLGPTTVVERGPDC